MSTAIEKTLYTLMQRIRMFEERVVLLYPEQEMKCPVHLCIGQEAIAAGVCANLRKQDYVLSNHRSHGHLIAKGMDMALMFAEFYGKATGASRGKGGSMHLIDAANSMPGTSAIVGGGIPMAVGAALASKMQGEDRISVAFFGDGAADEGVFYESLNFSALKKLPVIFICENNFYATNSHLTARRPTKDIAPSGQPFNIPFETIDGNDVLAVHNSAKKAISRAKGNEGPTLIEAITYRWKGHVGPDADFQKGFRPRTELEEWIKGCPIKRFEGHLLKNNIVTQKEMDSIRADISIELDSAVRFAKESPYPDPEDILKDVYYTAR
ncbi:MAG: thiamine pyrophosphate-dependent dehydrogenase E1 component subunit alpha [Deltaproteobacteria bacterium]|nr:thiamine pyrophosphate-dependent dehydrogenase E1 component subunit alpha [Deltaproteobacteria bacterium]